MMHFEPVSVVHPGVVSMMRFEPMQVAIPVAIAQALYIRELFFFIIHK